jgi:hypothetical protein
VPANLNKLNTGILKYGGNKKDIREIMKMEDVKFNKIKNKEKIIGDTSAMYDLKFIVNKFAAFVCVRYETGHY